MLQPLIPAHNFRCVLASPQRREWLVLLALFLGCGGGQVAQVSGRVTLDGAPLTTGTVAFHPVGGGPVAYGAVDAHGNYELQTGTQPGLAAGRYRVLVVAAGDPASPSNDPYAPAPLLTPPRYGDLETTPLEFTVESKPNQIDLPLKSS